jgi:hypothetical protein
MIVTLTTGWMIPSGTNSLPAEVLTQHPLSSHCYYHWVNISAGRLLVPEGIIHSVVIASALACFIRSYLLLKFTVPT